ncbi:MAG: hypothetical protein V3W20_09560, partial [Candidatus Neomarinimicrobiota bacterium]
DWLGDNWGEPESFHGRAGKMNFFNINAQSNAIYDSSNVEEYNSGWSTHTYSLMGEFNYTFIPRFQVLASGRIDKNTYTDFMYSPRVTLISEINDRNTIKVIWQKSLRMNTMMELYYQDLEGLDPEPEVLNTFQLIYDRLQNENLTFQISSYYNNAEILSWSGTNVAKIGELKYYGVELESKYKTGDNKWLFGINHSYTHLLDWEDFLKNTIGSRNQRISLSDFYYKKRSYLEFTSTGNSIINWADNITKFYTRIKFLDNLTLHMDSNTFWKYNYREDFIKMYKKAYDNVDTSILSGSDLTRYNTNSDLLEDYEKILDDKGALDLNWTFNASLTWNIPYFEKNKTTLTLYCQNIFDHGNSDPYGFFVNDLPIIGWQEDPRTFGMQLTAEL